MRFFRRFQHTAAMLRDAEIDDEKVHIRISTCTKLIESLIFELLRDVSPALGIDSGLLSPPKTPEIGSAFPREGTRPVRPGGRHPLPAAPRIYDSELLERQHTSSPPDRPMRRAFDEPQREPKRKQLAKTKPKRSSATQVKSQIARLRERKESLETDGIGTRAPKPCARCERGFRDCFVPLDPGKCQSFKCGYCILRAKPCSFSIERPGLDYPPQLMEMLRVRWRETQRGRNDLGWRKRPRTSHGSREYLP
ncbi:hypothetical protein F4677DRAFT_406925 [Hypoxylon crocopeplum]|nr:hypothetical protein F4677DRAFT_406925 [Hypoxylon crocopeplum]